MNLPPYEQTQKCVFDIFFFDGCFLESDVLYFFFLKVLIFWITYLWSVNHIESWSVDVTNQNSISLITQFCIFDIFNVFFVFSWVYDVQECENSMFGKKWVIIPNDQILWVSKMGNHNIDQSEFPQFLKWNNSSRWTRLILISVTCIMCIWHILLYAYFSRTKMWQWLLVFRFFRCLSVFLLLVFLRFIFQFSCFSWVARQ